MWVGSDSGGSAGAPPGPASLTAVPVRRAFVHRLAIGWTWRMVAPGIESANAGCAGPLSEAIRATAEPPAGRGEACYP